MRARPWMLRLSLLTLVASAAHAANPPTAPALEEAKQHADNGLALYKEARYPEAIAELEKAISLSIKLKPEAAGVVNYNLGQAYEKQGDIGSAVKAYKEYLRLVPKATDRAAVQTIIANLETRLAKGTQDLTVSSDPTGANLAVDGKLRATTPVTMELPFGSHELELSHEGYDTAKRTVDLTPQAAMKLDISLAKKAAPLPPPAPAPVVEKPKVWTWVALVGTGLAAGTAAVLGAQAKAKAKDLIGSPHSSSTSPTPDELYDASVNAQVACNVMWGVAGAAAITTGVLFSVEGKF